MGRGVSSPNTNFRKGGWGPLNSREELKEVRYWIFGFAGGDGYITIESGSTVLAGCLKQLFNTKERITTGSRYTILGKTIIAV